MRKKISPEIEAVVHFCKILKTKREVLLLGLALFVAPLLISWNVLTFTDTDMDGVSDVYDIDDDNDGITDSCECAYDNPSAVEPEADALNWTAGPLNIFTIGNNSNGMGYQESGFEKEILNRGQVVNFDDNPTYSSFNNGTISQTSGSASLSNSTSNAFISGNSGAGIRVDPVSGANSHTLTFNFTNSVYAFGFDLIDVFDCDNAGDDIMSYEIYADSYKVLKIEGHNIGASQTSTMSVYDGSNNLVGSYTVGQNTESFIGFTSQEAISSLRLTATYGNLSAIDFHGIDKFAFLTNYVCKDTDGDLVPNSLDLDSDNDGIPDLVEAGGADVDGDGRVDSFLDPDGDGLAAVFETSHGSTSVLQDPNGDGINEQKGDFDADNVSNWEDLDSDGDGIVDVIEARGADVDQNGQIDLFHVDVDQDGYADAVDGDVGNDGTAENTGAALLLTSADLNADAIPDTGYPQGNTDLHGNPDYLDIDADADGIVDNTEGQSTAGALLPNLSDDDGDGIDNQYDDADSNFGGNGISPVDTDGDTEADYQDTDSDGDTMPDQIEGHDPDGDYMADALSPANLGVALGIDADADGLDDGYDNNTASSDPSNSGLHAALYPKVYGGADQDWRAAQTLELAFLELQVAWKKGAAQLQWNISTSDSESVFQVERKMGNTGVFKQIGQVRTDLKNRYLFQDREIRSTNRQDKIFYRIGRIGQNGGILYSSMVELVIPSNQLIVQAYPIPASHELFITSSHDSYGPSEIYLVNTQGKKVLERKIKQREDLQVDIRHIPPGMYVLESHSEKGSSSMKIIIE